MAGLVQLGHTVRGFPGETEPSQPVRCEQKALEPSTRPRNNQHQHLGFLFPKELKWGKGKNKIKISAVEQLALV